MNTRGQALIESIPFILFLFGMMGILMTFAQWFLIHEKLLTAVREGAMLYSSGRVTQEETRARMLAYLENGDLTLRGDRLQIEVRRWPGPAWRARLLQLDEVRVTYTPSSWLYRFFEHPLEEKCVIKHAPHYGIPWQTRYGPRVPW